MPKHRTLNLRRLVSALSWDLFQEYFAQLRVDHRPSAWACPSFQPSPTLRRRLQDLGLDLALLHFRAPDSFALADFREQEALDLEFQHWDDYRSVRGRGPVLHLAPLQAQVVSILHQAALAGTPGLGWQSIRMRLSGNASSMRDIFKKSDPRSALVVYDSQSRLYRLNL